MAIHTITVPTHGQVDVTINEYGSGRPFVVLHGGAGPQSVLGFAQELIAREHAHAYVPLHPGFAGTTRPDWLRSIGALADIYVALLDQLDSPNTLLASA
jgi:pimeloyl-ACP methyl ester carboxylesterase